MTAAPLARRAWTGEVVRYGVVGVGSNAVLYAGYLLLTGAGMGPKTAMTLLYVVGVAQTYLFNRGWTFRHTGRVVVSGPRYAASYLAGYLFNLAALHAAVDRLGWPHRPVQAVLILATALLIFLLQKFWVFRAADQRRST